MLWRYGHMAWAVARVEDAGHDRIPVEDHEGCVEIDEELAQGIPPRQVRFPLHVQGLRGINRRTAKRGVDGCRQRGASRSGALETALPVRKHGGCI